MGLALVKALREAGAAKVYAGVRSPAGVAIDGAEVVQLDVTDPNSVEAAAARLTDVSLVFNNAGIIAGRPVLADDAIDAARPVMETNFYGPWRVAKAFAPALKANGGGAIVNILSVLSWVALPGTGSYSAAKAAAWALTNSLRKELADQKTHLLGVHVGYMDTDMTAGISDPKTAPAEVARQIIEALRDDENELLADDISKAVKSGLSAKAAAYF